VNTVIIPGLAFWGQLNIFLVAGLLLAGLLVIAALVWARRGSKDCYLSVCFLPIALACLFLCLTVVLVVQRNIPQSNFPNRSNFELTADISADQLFTGDTMVVKAALENKSSKSYEITHGLKLININLEKDGTSHAYPLPAAMSHIGAKEIIYEEVVITAEPGNYALKIRASFGIENKTGTTNWYHFSLPDKQFTVLDKE